MDPSDEVSEQKSVVEGQTDQRRTFWERFYGALTLDATVFDEIEHDPKGVGQAAGVVAIVAVAEGIGLGNFFGSLVSGFIGWVIATAVIWIIGVKILEHTSDFQELLRTIGFATAPKILLVLGLLPIGPLVGLVQLFVAFLVVVAFIVAVRQALDVKTGRALFICLVGVVANLVPSMLLGRAAWLF